MRTKYLCVVFQIDWHGFVHHCHLNFHYCSDFLCVQQQLGVGVDQKKVWIQRLHGWCFLCWAIWVAHLCVSLHVVLASILLILYWKSWCQQYSWKILQCCSQGSNALLSCYACWEVTLILLQGYIEMINDVLVDNVLMLQIFGWILNMAMGVVTYEGGANPSPVT